MNARSVYNILQRKGIDATVRTYPNAVFDPDLNKTTLGTAVDFLVKIIPPYRNIEGYKTTELITYGSGLTGIANYNLGFTIQVGLIVIINNKQWTVTGITPISNDTGILFYSLEIESGN